MELVRYTVERSKEDRTGEITATFEEDDEEYTVQFEFAERGTAPSAHSPFPSATDTELYAWPTEEVPDTLVTTVSDSDEALLLQMQQVDVPGITFIDEPYHEIDTVRSPFVENNLPEQEE